LIFTECFIFIQPQNTTKSLNSKQPPRMTAIIVKVWSSRQHEVPDLYYHYSCRHLSLLIVLRSWFPRSRSELGKCKED